MADFVFQRELHWTDSHRKYKIIIDDQLMGVLAPDKPLRVKVNPGTYSVEARIDWGRSKKTILEITDNDLAVLVKPSLVGWRILLFPFYLTLGAHNYLRIEPQPSSARTP